MLYTEEQQDAFLKELEDAASFQHNIHANYEHSILLMRARDELQRLYEIEWMYEGLLK